MPRFNRNKVRYKTRRRRWISYNFIHNALIWLVQIAIVCLFAFVFVWYGGQRVNNIGESMSPEIDNGDVVLVNRIVYNASTPNRGDVIVFKPNGNENSHYYLKRIVGLPGETIQIKDGAVYIDGKKLKEKYKTTKIEDPGIAEEEMTLADDEFFVLGDNRGNSEDSRSADVGNVKLKEIYGKAWLIFSPLTHMSLIRGVKE